MLGQVRLQNKFNSFTLETLPHSILLNGETGCGKHTLIKELCNRLELTCSDITDSISLETIQDICIKPTLEVYLIDTDSINERQQNIILKFLEEPLSNTYIVLLSSNKYRLLDTILNRCIIYDFDKYTKDELETFLESGFEIEDVISTCSTPGQIINLNTDKIKETRILCELIVDKIYKANYDNTLSIVNKINFKDMYDKLDLKVFIKLLMTVLKDKYIDTLDVSLYNMYYEVFEYNCKIQDARFNREYLLENLLTKLWKISRGC